MNSDLSNIKVGDEVIYDDGRSSVYSSVYNYSYSVIVVERVTVTQIILPPYNEGGPLRKFSRKTGQQIGHHGLYFFPKITIATPERIAEVRAARRKQKYVNQLSAVKWNDLDLATLTGIVCLLPVVKKENES